MQKWYNIKEIQPFPKESYRNVYTEVGKLVYRLTNLNLVLEVFNKLKYNAEVRKTAARETFVKRSLG